MELGCGLGVPALVAAARGAKVTALDWAPAAIELLRENAERNRIALEAVAIDWRAFDGSYDLVLGSDLLYEARNADALLEILPRLGPEVFLADPGRPAASGFFERARATWLVEELGERVYRLKSEQSRSASSAGWVRNGERPASSSSGSTPSAVRAQPA